MQNKNTYNLPKRSRYYQGIMDSRMLSVGEVDYNRLSAIYIIMIMPFDLFGQNRYRYTFTMRDNEDTSLELRDGAVRIFLNTRGKDPENVSRDLVELLNYMEHTDEQTANSCTNGQIRKMQERIEQIKVNERVGVKYMQAWEERILDMNEARQEGIEIGKERGIEIGTERGREEGLEEGRICQLFELYVDDIIDFQVLVEKMGKPKDEVGKMLEQYKKNLQLQMLPAKHL